MGTTAQKSVVAALMAPTVTMSLERVRMAVHLGTQGHCVIRVSDFSLHSHYKLNRKSLT